MTNYIPSQITTGKSPIESNDVNRPLTEAAAVINGNLDSNNLADGAVITAKLADGAVTTAKLGMVWQDWTPTLSGKNALTYTATVDVARYIQVGKIVYYRIRATGTTGGTTSNELRFTLPINATDSDTSPGSGYVVDGSARPGFLLFNSVNEVSIRRSDEADYGLGATRRIVASGFYEVV